MSMSHLQADHPDSFHHDLILQSLPMAHARSLSSSHWPALTLGKGFLISSTSQVFSEHLMMNPSSEVHKLYTPRKLIIGTTDFSMESCKTPFKQREGEKKH